MDIIQNILNKHLTKTIALSTHKHIHKNNIIILVIEKGSVNIEFTSLYMRYEGIFYTFLNGT